MATVLGNVLDFFKDLGIFDVVLPFILVFTIMYAILERTKLFGTEKFGTQDISKKNLNAMVSFVVAFLVVASSKLVGAITKVSSEVVVLLLLIVFFLMLVGSFRTEAEIKEGKFLTETPWRVGFMVVIAFSLVFIFLDAIETANGETWLKIFWDWLSQFYTNASVAAIVLVVAVMLFIFWVTRGEKVKDDKEGKK